MPFSAKYDYSFIQNCEICTDSHFASKQCFGAQHPQEIEARYGLAKIPRINDCYQTSTGLRVISITDLPF